MRMKAGIRLPVVKRLSDGDYLSWVRTPDKRPLTVRVIEYDVAKHDGTARSGRRSASLRPAPLEPGERAFRSIQSSG
jgi:hypothetical protein